MENTPTQSNGWRVFTWKNQSCLFLSKITSKQTNTQQPCWSLCNCMDPNHTQVFWSCSKINPFWAHIHVMLCEVLGYKTPKLVLSYTWDIWKDLCTKETNV